MLFRAPVTCNGWWQISNQTQIQLNNYYTHNYGAPEVQSVAAHELGHAIGLDHTSGAVLMNPSTEGPTGRWSVYGINTPQSDDINGVTYIYIKC